MNAPPAGASDAAALGCVNCHQASARVLACGPDEVIVRLTEPPRLGEGPRQAGGLAVLAVLLAGAMALAAQFFFRPWLSALPAVLLFLPLALAGAYGFLVHSDLVVRRGERHIRIRRSLLGKRALAGRRLCRAADVIAIDVVEKHEVDDVPAYASYEVRARSGRRRLLLCALPDRGTAEEVGRRIAAIVGCRFAAVDGPAQPAGGSARS